MSKWLPKDSLVLVDTNLAILLCVGLSGPTNIAKHKRTREYDSNDYDLLLDILPSTKNLVFSPYVLSETSNLVRQTYDTFGNQLSEILSVLILNGSEIQTECARIVKDSEYIRLGMTDAALLSILEEYPKMHLLTVDLKLYMAAVSRGYFAVNFLHVRDKRPDFQ